MTSSGTYNWFLSNADITLEAFDRCEIRPSVLTREHWQSARRSLNLELQTWSVKGQPNLWAVDLQTIPLTQGVQNYTLDPATITMLDAYLEQITFGTNVNQAPNYSTVANSVIVTVNIPSNGLLVGNWINIEIPVAVGGLLLWGFYQVQNTIDPNNFTINAASAATSTVSNTGVVPQFVATSGQSTVTVNLPNHNLQVGESFEVQTGTYVGGLTLFGSYPVQAVNSTSQFTINALNNATANDTEYENAGNTWIQTQAQSADPIDIWLKPIGRSEYAAYPDKFQQGRPTVYWYDRTSPIQSVNPWPVPDSNGPYAFKFYRLRRLQDANFANAETPDVTYRSLEALCAGMAKRLSVKYKPAKYALLKAEAETAYEDAFLEDRERVDINVRPDLGSYWDV